MNVFLKARITWLKSRLKAVEAENSRLLKEMSLRDVTDFHIGQMIHLGLGGNENCIYMQKVLNEYTHLLRCMLIRLTPKEARVRV